MVKLVDRGSARTASIDASQRRMSFIVCVCVVVFACVSGVAVADSSPADILVTVNGEPITAADLDEMIMAEHRSGYMRAESSGLVDRLL